MVEELEEGEEEMGEAEEEMIEGTGEGELQ